jgi:predicted ATPase
VLWGVYGFYLLRGELSLAQAPAEQLMRLAQGGQDPVLLVAAHAALGDIAFWRGELGPAQGHFAESAAGGAAQHRRSQIRLLGQDLQVSSLAYSAWILWWLGYPQQALRTSREALKAAREVSHPFSLSYAECFAGTLHQLRRDSWRVQQHAESLLALATDHGFAIWVALGTVLQGWALVERGQGDEGIAQMRQGLAAFRATGAELARTGFLTMLAEGYGSSGDPEEGLLVVAEALAAVEHLGIRVWEAELHRLQGVLWLRSSVCRREDREAEAEACFRHALVVACQQQAKSWELRAAMSLSRLWQQQGKREEARELLTPIYGWFTEGFDTADLQEAQALLEELS